MASLGSFSVEVLANIARFQSDLGKAQQIAERRAKAITNALKSVAGSLGVGLTGAAFVGWVNGALKAADAAQNLSARVGSSTEALSRLGVAAKLSDTSIGALQTSIGKLAKAQVDAARGGIEQVALFKAMGVEFQNLDGSLRASEDMLRDIADVFQDLPAGPERAALALKVFGRAGAELIPMLAEGSEGLDEFAELSDKLGTTINSNTAKAAEAFGDQLDILGLASDGAALQIAEGILPSLEKLTTVVVDLVEDGAFRDLATFVAEDLVTSFESAAEFIDKTSEAIDGFHAGIMRVGTVLSRFTQPTPRQLGQTPFAGPDLSRLGPSVPLQNNLIGLLSPDQQAAAQEAEVARTIELAAALDKRGQAQEDVTARLKQFLSVQTDAAAAARAERDRLREIEKELKALDKEWEDYANIIEDVQRDHRDVAESFVEMQAHFAEQEQDLRNEIDLLSLSGDARDDLAVRIDAERMARDKNGRVMEEERKKLEKLLAEYKKASKVDSIASQFENNSGLLNLVRDIDLVKEALEKAFDKDVIERFQGVLAQMNAQLAGDMVGSFRSLLGAAQAFTEQGSSGFKAMEKGMAALSIVEDILALKAAVTAVLTQGKGEPYSAFARMAAMAAAVAPMLASIGVTLSSFGGGGGSGPGAAQRQETQGTGTVLGDFEAKSESIANAIDITADATSKLVGINLGMLRALQSMQAAIGGASNLLARGAGGAAPTSLSSGASIPSIGGANSHSLFVQAFANIFGGKESLRDTGIRIVGGTLSDMIDDIMVQSYATIHRSGGWFSSSRNFDRTAAIGDEVAVQFQLVLESMADAVREGAEALGMDLEAVNAAIAAFEIEEIRISTMDLSAEEAQAELEAVFASIFDGLAGAVVPFIAQFQQVGEGLGETLVRVATGVQVTQEAITQLGFALEETDPERFAQISEGLIGLVGGIDEFISGMSTFVNAFASEEHKFEVAQDAITRAFAQFGLTIPATRDAMWDLMQSLDATTEEGREQIAMLLRLAGTADQYYDMLEEQQEAVNRASEEAAAAAVAAMSSYEDFVRQFDDTNEGLLGGLRGLEDQFKRDLHQANLLAEAAGLKRARLEDLERIEMRYLRAREQMIKDLTQTVIGQIAELYGTSAQQLEAQIADLDTAIAGVFDNMGSGPGFIQAFFREMELQAQRSGLVEQLEAQRATEEALRRQTGALDLAQNLADLSLARGIDFGALAAELGLNLDAFGADLGLTGKGIFELINTLQTESLTSDVFGEGVQQIVGAILQSDGLEESRAENFAKSYAETEMRGTYRDERDDALLEEVRAMRAENAILLSLVATNTGTTATASTEVARIGALDRLQGEASARGGFRQPKPTLERG